MDLESSKEAIAERKIIMERNILRMYHIYKLFHPEIFQGKYRKKHYFEGWYFKIIDKNKEHALAVIPGISLEKDSAHAFIQVLDHNNNAYYFRYPITDFYFHPKKFEIKIGDNYFSKDKMLLNLNEKNGSIRGRLDFSGRIEFPKTPLRPGIMGPYSFVPFMECYHGIVTVHHEINGRLALSGKTVDFTGGYGYVEKDWGRSFPEYWIWFQSNHFTGRDATVMFSVAKIPWFFGAFTGFISFLRYKERVIVFATYTGAKLRRLEYKGSRIRAVLSDPRFCLELEARQADGGSLMAPKNGLMEQKIVESINAAVKVRLSDRRGNKIFEGTGTNAGLEVFGIKDI